MRTQKWTKTRTKPPKTHQMSTQNTQNTPIQPENIEKRAYVGGLEIRAAENGQNSRKVNGYAALYNTRTELYPGFFEEIAPGAFDQAINISDVRALYNHSSMHVLGRNKSGTLKLNLDQKGMPFELDLPETRADLVELIKRGDINQCSFAFTIKEEKWTNLGNGDQLRTILKVERLYDISLVTYPAYEDATFSLSRSSEDAIKERREAAKAPEIPEIQEPDQNDINLKLMVAEIDF